MHAYKCIKAVTDHIFVYYFNRVKLMSASVIFLCIILAGTMLIAKADLTLREVEQKINNLDSLERNLESLIREFSNLTDQLKKRQNISDEFELRLSSNVEILDKRINNLTIFADHLNQNFTSSEAKIVGIQNQLKQGGKNFQIFPHNSM